MAVQITVISAGSSISSTLDVYYSTVGISGPWTILYTGVPLIDLEAGYSFTPPVGAISYKVQDLGLCGASTVLDCTITTTSTSTTHRPTTSTSTTSFPYMTLNFHNTTTYNGGAVTAVCTLNGSPVLAGEYLSTGQNTSAMITSLGLAQTLYISFFSNYDLTTNHGKILIIGGNPVPACQQMNGNSALSFTVDIVNGTTVDVYLEDGIC